MNLRQAKKSVMALALAVAALMATVMALSTPAARAQGGGEIYVDKKLGRADPLVHVGEYLTFTILVRNDAPFAITRLPLADAFNTAVLAFADALPPPDRVDEATGRIDWDDLTTTFGDLAPGHQIIIVVGFVAEHPAPVVVNRADVHDALGSGGVLSDTNSIITGTESVGGSSPVDKELLAGVTPQVGLPLTFTIVITNDGFTTMTVAPLVDVYDPALLQFSYAVPPPDVIDAVNGVLSWSDVTHWTGDIPAHGTVVVTTVFTALAAIDSTVNRAEVGSASDWYGNDLGGGGDDVPITIIEGPTPTSAPAPTATPLPAPTATRAQPAPTAVPITVVPAATTTPAPAMPTPFFLPESGQAKERWSSGLLMMAVVVGAGMFVLVHRKQSS